MSAHLLINDAKQPFGNLVPRKYNNELLHLAHELASRLLPAFENTRTGLPYPRVSLLYAWKIKNIYVCIYIKLYVFYHFNNLYIDLIFIFFIYP